MIIAVDHGNSAVKTERFVFPSALEQHAKKPPLAIDVLEYGGSYWSLSGQRIPFMMDKTKDERFFILTLFAISMEMRHLGFLPPCVDIDLAVGLPPEHFPLLRDQFVGYLKRGRLDFVYNDKLTTIDIRNVIAYPQAYSAVVSLGTRLKEEPRIFIVDIGGYTIDVLLLKKSVPDLQFCRSFENGVITIANTIIGKIGAKYGIKLAEEQIIAAIRGDQQLVVKDDVLVDIHQLAMQYSANILDELRENMVELKANPVIFVGGGAILLRPFLEKSPMVAKADFILDEKANATGYAILATHQLKNIRS